MKAMGTGWRKIRWKDIEITGGGKPTVRMSGNAARRAEMLGVTEVLVTITHTDTDALVMAIAVGEQATPGLAPWWQPTRLGTCSPSRVSR